MKFLIVFILMAVLFMPGSASADLFFYDNFTGDENTSITGHVPNLGGGAYEFTPPPGNPTYYTHTSHMENIDGGRAYLWMQNDSGTSASILLRETTNVNGINYTTAPEFYITFSVEASIFTKNSHIDLITGIVHGTVTREHQVGIARRDDWFGDTIQPYAWGSDASSGHYDLGDYNNGMITMALKYKMEPASGTQYKDYVYAAVVPATGQEPVWIQIAYETGMAAPYELDFLRLELGISGSDYTGYGFIEEIKIGTTWADVAPVPIPGAALLLGSGLIGLLGLRRKTKK